MSTSKLVLYAGFALLGSSPTLSTAQTPPAALAQNVKPLLDLREGVEKRLFPTSNQVSVTHVPQGLTVTIAPGDEAYPGLNLKPEGGSWNLSNYGHVEARLVNTSTKDLALSLRVDNSEQKRHQIKTKANEN